MPHLLYLDITFLILTLLSFVSVHNSVFLGCKPCCKILCYKVMYYKVDTSGEGS